MTQSSPLHPSPAGGKGASPWNWPALFRVLLKAALLFAALNLLFAALYPMAALGRLSAYNLLFPGRERFPFGENPAQSYNLSLYNLDAMFASLALRPAKPAGEYRLLVVGDSSVWGTLLRPAQTLAGQINALQLNCGGKAVRAYNLGYPTLSVTKDLMVLQEAMRYQPDQVLWLTTLEGLLTAEQLRSPILANNPERARALIDTYHLPLDASALNAPSFWERTLIGQRRPLADLLRLQLYGALWGATGIDQVYDWNPQKDAAQRDLAADPVFHGLSGPALDQNRLALDVLQAGSQLVQAGGARLLLVNEPILVSSGQNSDIRYNFYYPRWAYDQYRVLMGEQAKADGWRYLDLWNLVAEREFTNSAIHLTPAGETLLAQTIGENLCK